MSVPVGQAPVESGPSQGSNFFIAFRVLPPERRQAITAVYGFCRKADDAVDDAADTESGRRALDRVAAELDRAYSGDTGDAEVAELVRAIDRFDLPRAPFDDLIEGVSWDLDGRRYADVDALREYCYRVASTVGLLCVRIFGIRDGAGDTYARELGVALQWTNILRDIAADRERGRVYLPESSLHRHGLDEHDLDRPDEAARNRLSALIREEARYARGCFLAADAALAPSDRPRVVAAEIMAAVYRDLLTRVERAGDRVLDQRQRVPGARRVWIAARTVLAERWRRRR